jgi:hypothetical protein
MKLPADVSKDADNEETDHDDEILLFLPNVAAASGDEKATSRTRLCRERLLPNVVVNDRHVSHSARRVYTLKATVTEVFIVNYSSFIFDDVCGMCMLWEKRRLELLIPWGRLEVVYKTPRRVDMREKEGIPER